MKIAIVLISLFCLGCLARTVVKKIPGENHTRQNQFISQHIDSLARNGDWLVIRGYHDSDNIVANATGIPISHVAILDKEQKTVIEADNSGIHTTPLIDFIDNSYRILIIRPRWQTTANKDFALRKAYHIVGSGYDFPGTIGLDIKDRYYCSELAVYIYREWYSENEKLPKVIKPGELYLFGKILFDSRPRDEMDITDNHLK